MNSFSNLYLFPLGGAIRLVEEHLGLPLSWDICVLHTNELPFKKLFKLCDNSGKDVDTKSPSYDEHIGRQIKYGLDLKPIINFNAIAGKVHVFTDDFIKTFNNDTKYLYNICQAIQNGYRNFPEDLVYKLIGHCHQGR